MLNIHQMFRSKYRPGATRLAMISEFMQREERLRFTALEISHRTKNLLAVVQAIADQTAQRSATLKDFQARFSQRLQGLSRSVDLLIEEDGHGASIAAVVSSQLEPFGQVDGVRIAASGPDVPLNSDAAQRIGQALHELATNATKYGALSVPEGWITVRWQLGPDNTGQPCFRLRWCERNGPKVLAPSRRGFGHVVLGGATGQALQGKVNHEFEARGVSWTLEAPLSAVGMLGPNERSVNC